jgi:hypothetical protein
MSVEPVPSDRAPRALRLAEAARTPCKPVESVPHKAGRRCANIPALGTGNEVPMQSEGIPNPLLAEAAKVYRQGVEDRGVWLYAIQADGDDGPIKIGVTNWPATRIVTLQQGNAAKLRGLAAWPAMREEERMLHAEFAHARIRGEWFRPVPELVERVLLLGGFFDDWTTS